MENDLFMKPVKLLITHANPDLDACGACWLFLKFADKQFEEAQLYFVNAGEEVSDETLKFKELERDEVVHVDTGLGQFDHHQMDNKERDSATLRVYGYITRKYPDLGGDEALKRLVHFINENDHFASCYWPEADNDRYQFMLEEMIKGVRQSRQLTDRETAEMYLIALDGVYAGMKMKVKAEADLDAGQEFESGWGKGLAIDNKNDEVMKLAMKKGYQVVVRRNTDSGHIRIKAVPDRGIDLTPLYDTLVKQDPFGTWYLHSSRAMLLNGSEHNEKHVATSLTLHQVVEIMKNIK